MSFFEKKKECIRNNSYTKGTVESDSFDSDHCACKVDLSEKLREYLVHEDFSLL